MVVAANAIRRVGNRLQCREDQCLVALGGLDDAVGWRWLGWGGAGAADGTPPRRHVNRSVCPEVPLDGLPPFGIRPRHTASIYWAELRRKFDGRWEICAYRFETFRYSFGDCLNQRRNTRAKAVEST